MRMLPVHNSEASKEKTSERKIFNYPPTPAKEYKAQESRQFKGKNVGIGILGETGHTSQLQKTLQMLDKLAT